MLSDPATVIQVMPPGSMIYARINGKGGPETAFLVREESARIKGFGSGPRVEVRTALLSIDNIALIPVLAAIGSGSQQELYETWLNVHQTGGGMHYLEDLCRQDMLRFAFYGERGHRRAIGAVNALHSSFNDILREVRQMTAWDMTAFDRARETIYRRHSSARSLWDALGPDNGGQV